MGQGNPHAAEASLRIARLAEAGWSAHQARRNQILPDAKALQCEARQFHRAV